MLQVSRTFTSPEGVDDVDVVVVVVVVAVVVALLQGRGEKSKDSRRTPRYA